MTNVRRLGDQSAPSWIRQAVGVFDEEPFEPILDEVWGHAKQRGITASQIFHAFFSLAGGFYFFNFWRVKLLNYVWVCYLARARGRM